MKKTSMSLMILCVVVLALAGCAPAADNLLAGTSWRMTSYGPASAQIAAAPATSLVFGTDGQVSGNMGCNGMGGKYSVSGQSITFGPLISTKMACEEPRMAQETEALKVFNGTVSFVLAGSTLTITSADGSSALTFVQVAAP